jgi:hypothetical protein
MRWGTPKEYAAFYRASLTDQYKTGFLFWLEHENPDLWQLVKKELRQEISHESANDPVRQTDARA